MPISVAIIGSGPAGFYTAEALAKSDQDCQIDIIERLPTPYGLVRGGVAPDHQTTKRIAAKFEQTALREVIRYYGNVEVGADVSVDELREAYDAVVLAVGAAKDRPLTIPGADKKGVFGAAEFVGWYNGHPDFCDLDPNLDVAAAAVIGVGNVAIDVARVLVKTPDEMAKSDLPDYAAYAIHQSPLSDVFVLGRRGPIEAKFTNVELREMGRLVEAEPRVVVDQLPKNPNDLLTALSDRDRRLKERNLATLHEFSEGAPDTKPKRVHFEFYAAPVEVLGNDRVWGLRLERTRVVDGRAEGTGSFFEIECGLVVSSIGYRSERIEGAPFDEENAVVPNNDGRVAEGLYAAGWIKRGPTGVISTNRADGETVAAHIVEDLGSPSDSGKRGRSGLEALLTGRRVRVVGFDDWKTIDAMETANATEPAPRCKFVTVDTMLDALDGADRAAKAN